MAYACYVTVDEARNAEVWFDGCSISAKRDLLILNALAKRNNLHGEFIVSNKGELGCKLYVEDPDLRDLPDQIALARKVAEIVLEKIEIDREVVIGGMVKEVIHGGAVATGGESSLVRCTCFIQGEDVLDEETVRIIKKTVLEFIAHIVESEFKKVHQNYSVAIKDDVVEVEIRGSSPEDNSELWRILAHLIDEGMEEFRKVVEFLGRADVDLNRMCKMLAAVTLVNVIDSN